MKPSDQKQESGILIGKNSGFLANTSFIWFQRLKILPECTILCADSLYKRAESRPFLYQVHNCRLLWKHWMRTAHYTQFIHITSCGPSTDLYGPPGPPKGPVLAPKGPVGGPIGTRRAPLTRFGPNCCQLVWPGWNHGYQTLWPGI